MKELYLLIEEEELNPQQQADNKTCTGDNWSQNTVSWNEGALENGKLTCRDVCLSGLLWMPCNDSVQM